MRKITAKFGGSSLADASQFKKVAEIIKSDSARRYIVASAPGKRFSADTKVTDLLYRCFDEAAWGKDYSAAFGEIKNRYEEIINGLGMNFSLRPDFDAIEKELASKPSRDYMASRGEYLNSKLLAAYLGFEFIDPAECVFFDENGEFDAERTNRTLEVILEKTERAVIAGFYGSNPDGSIRTFSRGGSDLTGAIAARASMSDVYENWTDVSGVLMTDPRVVDDPKPIDYISYSELREMSYMGASVMHEAAVFPVSKAGIPINIRNTNDPSAPGTMIVPSLPKAMKLKHITGIAGSKGFSSIQVEKSMMNAELGFGARLMNILAEHGVSFEHCPTGIDTMSVLVESQYLAKDRDALLRAISDELAPDMLFVEDGIALIAIVGHGMAYSPGIYADILKAVADAGVDLRLIDLGSSKLNLIIGVGEEDYEKAVRAIYYSIG